MADIVDGEKTAINGFRPVNNYSNFELHITNSTAAPLSLTTLNTNYPSTTRPIGFMVICSVINLAYIKTGATTWISVPTTTVT